MNGLRARARLCDRLERLAMSGTDADTAGTVDEIASAWDKAGPFDRSTQEAIEARYRLVTSALAGDEAAKGDMESGFDKGLAQRRRLCLELEVLAGVESPPEDQAARMALRVERLGRSLVEGGSHGAVSAERRRLERAWYTCGPVAPEHAETLAARFERALGAARAAET